MSDCKINQFMEFGDIIYIIVLIFFFVFGIINDSIKKKNAQKQNVPSPGKPVIKSKKTSTTPPKIPYQDIGHEAPPAVYKETGKTPAHREFQSSLDLVTNFEGESALKGSMFGNRTDYLYEEPESISSSENRMDKKSPFFMGYDELKKGIIYSEILKRKF